MNFSSTPARRQGLSLAAALALHAIAFAWLAHLPGPTAPGEPGNEHVILAHLISEPAPLSLAALLPAATPATPEAQSAPSPPREAAASVGLPKPATRPISPATATVGNPAVSPAVSSAISQPVSTAPSAAAPAIAPATNPAAAPGTSASAPASVSAFAAGSSASATVQQPGAAGPPAMAGAASNTASTASNTRAGGPPAAEPELAARPDYAYNPKPDYPSTARQFGLTGKVLVRVLVETDGAPREILIADSSGHDILDQAALRSVKRWRFLPARHSGQAYASWIEFNVRFDLTN